MSKTLEDIHHHDSIDGGSFWSSSPFWSTLDSAAASGWSGKIEVHDDLGPTGLVVFHHGRIAWAVCRNQKEDLGSFLHKLGKIEPEQLSKARDLYKKEGGRRKLGTILEQDLHLQRPILRHCLRLHARRAVDAIAARQDLFIMSSSDTPDVLDDELTFPLDDFLPSTPSGKVPSA